MIDYIAAWAGEWGFVQHIKAQYRNPAFTGDATVLDAVVSEVKHVGGKGIAVIVVTMATQTGQVMAKAIAEVELPLT
jgi:hypothetical protein